MAQQVSRLQIDVRPALMTRFNRLLALGELSTQRELLDTSVTVPRANTNRSEIRTRTVPGRPRASSCRIGIVFLDVL